MSANYQSERLEIPRRRAVAGLAQLVFHDPTDAVARKLRNYVHVPGNRKVRQILCEEGKERLRLH